MQIECAIGVDAARDRAVGRDGGGEGGVECHTTRVFEA